MANTTAIATLRSTALMDDDWGHPARLSVARSHAYALLVNGAEDTEITTALARRADLVDEVEQALSGARRAAMVVTDFPDAEAERFISEIGGFMKLTGGGWPVEQREEFIEQATIDLADIPVSILAPAVRLARRRVYDPRRFVPWVIDATADDVAKLAVEVRNLTRLMSLAKG